MLEPLTHALLSDSRIAHGFFTRRGGVSRGLYASLNCGPGSHDNPADVIENRARVAAHLGVGAAALSSAHQVHSAQAVILHQPIDPAERPQADALVTNLPGIALGILTADCAPVLLHDPHAAVIGAAHAGWKGACGGILESTLLAMEKLGAQRSHICAVIGPTIAQASYEVGEDFIARFTDEERTQFFIPSYRSQHWRFDLPAYCIAALRRAGLTQVGVVARDTCALAQDFFSNRRRTLAGEPDYGRQISAIMLR